jgi:DNA-directed RNA polymerase I, II, and III subunit RPABC1
MEEIDFLRNAWNTSLEIVKDRNYVLDDNYYKIEDIDFRHLVLEKKMDIFAENADKTSAIFIKFVLNPKIKPSTIKTIIEEIKEQCPYPNVELIIVLKVKPNNTILKIEKEKYGQHVQIMWCKQLQFNITKHTLVPKHTKCLQPEIDELIKKYMLVNKYQLPILLRDDPIARYYNYKSGDIIKITSTNLGMNQHYLFYRCVK